MNGVAFLGELDENPLVLSADQVQTRLGENLDRLNREHGESLVAPLTPSGEFPEFGAVLRDLSVVYPVARHLAEAFHPLPVRIGAAWGEINPAAADDPEQMDGPAFDQAGELLYRSRKEDRLLLIQGEDPVLDTMANALFLVLYRDLRNWTERQCEVVRLYRRHGRQREVARELGVSQQSVSSSLAAAGWKVLAEAEDSLRNLVRKRPDRP